MYVYDCTVRIYLVYLSVSVFWIFRVYYGICVFGDKMANVAIDATTYVNDSM